MVKLTEIYSGPTEYDPKKAKNNKAWLLREVYVNPSFVALVKENMELTIKSKAGELISGLNKNTGFTKILINLPTSGINQISVVGAPQGVLEKLDE
tara:strand:+ start:58 stop:345 length:288 start_codon:yes stop_codon:yes gene_type:complete